MSGKTKAEVLAEGKAYIDELARTGRIVSTLEEMPGIDGTGSYGGLGYIHKQDVQFGELVRYYVAAADQAAIASYPALARKVLDRVESEPDEFTFDLCVNNARESPYYHVPILAAITPAEFATKVLAVSPTAQIRIFRTLKARYEGGALERELAPEKPWLAKVCRKLRRQIPSAPPMTRHRIKSILSREIESLL